MTRYFDQLIKEFNLRANAPSRIQRLLIADRTSLEESRRNNAMFLSILNDQRCKRILFDSRQAATFDQLGEGPPVSWQAKLHTPFDWFYLELTEGIRVGEQEPGRDDILKALLVRTNIVKAQSLPSDALSLFSNVTFLLQAGNEETVVDRSFLFELTEGLAMTRAASTQQTTIDPSQLPESIAPDAYITVGDKLDIEHRYLGWWERTILDYSSLLSWMLVYMMAKGIRVVEEPISRQQRRLYARKGLPSPWHIVVVEPRISSHRAAEDDSSYHHGYRYDVMGHLRFGKHKLRDGDYRETIEWVRDHQRGLANDLYIPKTSKFEEGKVTHPAMGRYFVKED